MIGASWEGGGTAVDTTGEVRFELEGVLYVRSASVVYDTASGRSLVLTAAHCVYERTGSGAFAQNWMFIPNSEKQPAKLDTEGNFCAQTIYGCWTATALVVHDGFASAGGFNASAIVFTDVARRTFVYAFGHPHAAAYDGSALVHCAGGADFDNRLARLTYKLACDMTGGSSGGPWCHQFDGSSGTEAAISVNSYRYIGGSDIYGPKLNSSTESLYHEAHSATRTPSSRTRGAPPTLPQTRHHSHVRR